MNINQVKQVTFLILFLFIVACDDSSKKKSSSSLLPVPKMSLLNPVTSPSNLTTPTLHITEVKDADQVYIYSDASCSQLITSSAVTGESLDLVLPSLTSGAYKFYAIRNSGRSSSPCTSEFVYYDLDLTPPAITIALKSQALGNQSSTFEWALNFDGADSITLSSSDIILTGQTQGCVATVSGAGNTTRTVSLSSCSGQGSLNISIPANVSTDALGNQSVLTTNTQDAVEVDNQAPVALLSVLPAGLVIMDNFNVKVSANTQISSYQYKFGVASTTDCSVSSGYSSWTPVEIAWQEVSTSLATGNVKICVVGKDAASNAQTYTNASSKILIKENSSPEINFADAEKIVDTGSGLYQFKVNLSVVKSYDIKFFYTIEGDAIYGLDHNLLGNQEVTIPAGQTSVNIETNILQNNVSASGYSILRAKIIRADKTNIVIGTANQSNLLIKYPGVMETVLQIEIADDGHSCAIMSSGALKCWGSNNYGQVGNGNKIDQITPILIDPSVSYSQVVFGSSYTCGLTTTGVLKCWGYNSRNIITSSSTPLVVDSGVSYSKIYSGNENICGITTSGVLKCWGSNAYGQVGDGSTITRTSPVVIDSGVSYSSITNKDSTVCGITASGTLKCWGDNSIGQLGDGSISSTVDKKSPVVIDSGVNYKQVIVRQSSVCALTIDGILKCWGFNSSGQVGDGTNINKSSITVIDSGVTYSQVYKGGSYTCAITSSGVLKCWGSNSDYQLGTGNSTSQNLPIVIDSGVTYKDFISNYYNSCAITTSGTLKCWGSSLFGNGGSRTIKSPVVIDSGVNYSKIAAPFNQSTKQNCGITEAGILKCWGNNIIGQLGNSTPSSRSLPTEIDKGVKYNHIGGGANYTCGKTNEGTVNCWGGNGNGQVGNLTNYTQALPVNSGSGFVYDRLISGENNSCGLTSAGFLKCWGANGNGQIGKGSTSSFQNYPILVDTSTSYTQLIKGFYHTCGITSSGALKCWGRNNYGQVGDGTSGTDRPTPLVIDSGVSYSKINTNPIGYHNCGITTNGVLKCWGFNNKGQIGDGTSGAGTDKLSPVVVDSGTTYSEVNLADSYSCAITTSGALKCWGDNIFGQIGKGSNAAQTTPIQIDNGVSYSKIILGSFRAYGITQSGVLKAWGYNPSGLGNGSSNSSSSLPVVIDNGITYSQISLTSLDYHACGITTLGVLKCWGSNTYGEVGVGNTISQSTPQIVNPGVLFSQVYVGVNYTCAITTDGILKCWGKNDYGQLGDGGDPSFLLKPLNIMKWLTLNQ